MVLWIPVLVAPGRLNHLNPCVRIAWLILADMIKQKLLHYATCQTVSDSTALLMGLPGAHARYVCSVTLVSVIGNAPVPLALDNLDADLHINTLTIASPIHA